MSRTHGGKNRNLERKCLDAIRRAGRYGATSKQVGDMVYLGWKSSRDWCHALADVGLVTEVRKAGATVYIATPPVTDEEERLSDARLLIRKWTWMAQHEARERRLVYG